MTSHICDIIKNQPTISVIKTAVRVDVVVPKPSQAQSVRNSIAVFTTITLEKDQTNTLNHLRGILTNDT